jgi:hypothetical protein
MNNRDVRTSPQVYARLGGVFYLIIIVVGALGEAVVRSRLVVTGDPAATAARIMASEFLWRASVASELFMLACAVPLALIFYLLLRPVSPDLALLAAFFNLVSIALEAANKLRLLDALFPLANADYLKVLAAEELHTLAYLSIRSHAYGFGVALIFFGCVCLIVGHLIVRSGYLPRLAGVLMQIAGLCYLTNSFALILSPPVAAWLFPAILLPALLAEASLCVWLLTKGVNVSAWNARVRAAS